MALADLIARLEHDADVTVRTLAEEADTEARAIDEAARQERDRRTTRIVSERREARQAALRQQLSDARRALRGQELEAREALVARVLARARALVDESTDTDAYRDSLRASCTEALSYLEGVPCRVRCRPADVPIIAHPRGRDDVTVEGDETTGPGLVVEALDGSVTIDQTLDARLTRMAGHLAMELLAEVDGGKG